MTVVARRRAPARTVLLDKWLEAVPVFRLSDSAEDGSLGFVAAALSLLALALAVRIMPETRQPGTQVLRRRIFDWHAVRTSLTIPTVGLLITVFFLATFGFAQFETTLFRSTSPASVS